MDERFFAELSRTLEERGRLALATVVAVKGSGPARVGRRMEIFDDGTFRGTIGGGPFEALVVADAVARFESSSRPTLLKWYDFFDTGKGEPTRMICGGSAQVYLELLKAAPQLSILGGGHVGLALARAALPLDFAVAVWDDRPEYAAPERFPQGVRVLGSYRNYATPEGALLAGRDHYVSIVTRCWETDLKALRPFLAPDAPPTVYLGVIGSARKLRLIFKKLREEGVEEDRLRAVRAPIGLPIGAVTPEEIAVAILAEVVATRRGLAPEAVPLGPVPLVVRA